MQTRHISENNSVSVYFGPNWFLYLREHSLQIYTNREIISSRFVLPSFSGIILLSGRSDVAMVTH